MWVKICGTTSEEDALLAVAMGADAIGFIFAPSVRQVSPMVVADIVKRLPSEIITVGVFRNELPERVISVANAAGLRAAQLHGHETPDQVQFVRRHLSLVIKAFSAGDPAVAGAAQYGADALLLDAPNPGSGQVFDWALVGEAPPGQRVIMAGGLTPKNVAASIVQTRPWGVDVASGVEREPGHKDPVKLRAFIAAAKSAVVPGPERASPGPYDWQEEG